MAIQVQPILAFKDNYIWCLINDETNHCIIVDPGEAKPVLGFLKRSNLSLDALFITHHHWDHTNGIKAILKDHSAPVFGPAKEKIAGVSNPVDEGDTVELNNWPITFKVLAIPGHTLGHIAYYGDNLLFCGDTLFSAGCGRLFEGTAEQMLDSLNKLSQLPDETQIYCGHEYTLNNLNFAQMLEPNNVHVKEYLERVRELRQKNLPSLPCTLSTERLVNPFLRCDKTEILSRVERHRGKKFDLPAEAFAYLRQWKNNYK
ncbi:hydroxyacylglutathione hydrolase [Candidatus Rickettsiella viridis]|uniref:Hydroxyacylglutathione hydrolase n=1 Tax=Candidatus Rickettsiella viridis TaxID=676208 RepID=A0A2Z5UUD3_9COXI|nr:hydroxyacylglutathione hydrolase [Candidatus Rickettsiella viridis]BBB14655.1 hydroxyacylglutathione hydrolase [Candidatus Rickettsiella viridis]